MTVNYEHLFSLLSLSAVVGWLALALAPLRRPLFVAIAQVVGVGLAVSYLALFVTGRSQGPPPDFSSLASVGLGFERPHRLLAGWTHFLAFDLLIGAWQTGEAGKLRIPHLLVIPCLALTFMFGPAGLLLFLVLREVFRHRRQGRAAITYPAP